MYLAGDGRPYLPGSSVKGALRTAWLEALYNNDCPNQGPKSSQWEDDILGGDFQKSPLRLLKIGDFMPRYDEIARKIMFVCNYLKKIVDGKYKLKGKGPVTRKEAVLSGQYRAFVSGTVLLNPGEHIPQGMSVKRPVLADLAQYCNTYYLSRLDRECLLLRQRGFVDENWLERVRDLLEQVTIRQNSGKIFLLRLGRHGDAETKTIRDLAQIKIRSTQGSPPRYQKETTAFRLAADSESQETGLLPFGWALVEIDPQGENDALRRWCEEERASHPDMRGVRALVEERKARLALERAERRKAETERLVREQEEFLSHQQQERELAAMSGEQRQLHEFCQILERHLPLRPRDAGALILVQCTEFLEKALQWPAADQKQCAERVKPLIEAKNMFLMGKRGDQIKELLSKLRG
jgi:CRISPR-associated protein Csm5